MKEIVFLLLLLSGCVVQSCKDFLDVQPRNSKVVSTIEDYRDILASYMVKLKSINPYPEKVLGGTFNFPQFDMTDAFAFYSGEVMLGKNSFFYDSQKGEWNQTAVNKLSWLDPNTTAYSHYYQFLGPINLVIAGISEAKGKDEELRNYVKGEALVWRAYAFYKLLQYYAPYREDKYGVPVYLKPYEDPGHAMPARKTQTEVFEQILSDCREVQKLLEQTPAHSWNCAYDIGFLNAMLADIYCWKAMSAAAEDKDWELCADYASRAMAGRELTDDPKTFRALFNCNPDDGGLVAMTHDECYLRLIDGNNASLLGFVNTYCNDGFINTTVDGLVDTLFYKKYRDDDIRKEVYFKERYNGVCYNKYNFLEQNWFTFPNGGVLMPFRLAAMYLTKAEALVHLNREGEARQVLDKFKAHRYMDVQASYTESDLLNEILKERELEFYQENDFRWLDMKRLRLRMEREVNGITYILEPDDFRYSLPIPNDEMKNNLNMVQTPGWDKVFF